ncbi:PqqD family protein [Aerolutibacter daejeonensis]|nr:PqqD family protein [Lysobacter daejeonensis]
MPFPLSPTMASNAHLSPDVRMQVTGTESVLLDLRSERYFGLNAVGTRVWQLLTANPSLQAAHQAVLQEYEVGADQLAQDMLTLVAQLAEAGLLTLDA